MARTLEEIVGDTELRKSILEFVRSQSRGASVDVLQERFGSEGVYLSGYMLMEGLLEDAGFNTMGYHVLTAPIRKGERE